MGHTFLRQVLARSVPIEVVSELAVHGMRHRGGTKQCQNPGHDELAPEDQVMKLLTSQMSWKLWIQAEEGRFSDAQHPPPGKYPCFAYLALESWGQETQRAVYLYQHDVEAMALELLAMAQKM